MGDVRSTFQLVLKGGETSRIFTASVMNEQSEREAENTFEWRYDSTALNLDLGALARAVVSEKPSEEAVHSALGQRLYQSVFAGQVGELWQARRKQARRKPLPLVLRVDPQTARPLLNLPWEYLHDGQEFLSLNRRTPLSRLPLDVDCEPLEPLEESLRMLVVISAPTGLSQDQVLNYAREEDVILEATADAWRSGRLQVEFAPNGSLKTLGNYLREYDPHILHFVGHGVFADDQDFGLLLMEDEKGSQQYVPNPTFAKTLIDKGDSLRLVFLSACQSAKVSRNSAFADLGPRLLAEGIPAVVAMQFSVFNHSAIELGKMFYSKAVEGNPLEEALAEAREAMAEVSPNGIDFGTPVLYLFDPFCLQVISSAASSSIANTPRDMSGVTRAGNFVGRSVELRELATKLDPETGQWRAAVIHGLGGMGKTVLAARLAERMGSRLDGVKTLRMSPSTTAGEVLNSIGEFLLVNNARFNLPEIPKFHQTLQQPISLESKAGALLPILERLKLLLVFDNCEDILPAGKYLSRTMQAAEQTPQSATQELNVELLNLISILVGNFSGPSRFLFTSRIDFSPVEQGRLVGEVGHFDLGEMGVEDAIYLMETLPGLSSLPVSSLNGSDSAGVTKRQVYERLGGHPYTLGLFASHAARSNPAAVLQNLSEVRKELLEFTLMEGTVAKLSERAKQILKRGAIYGEPVEIEGLAYLMGDEQDCMPDIHAEAVELQRWGLLSQLPGTHFLTLHSLAKEWVRGEMQEGERLGLQKRAAGYWMGVGRESSSMNAYLYAWYYLYTAGAYEQAGELVSGITEYLLRWGQLVLLLRLLQSGVDTLQGKGQAIAQHNLGIVLHRVGALPEACQCYEQALAISQELVDNDGVAKTLHMLGRLRQDQSQYQQARQYYEQSLAIKQELGDRADVAISLLQLGMLDHEQGEYPEARQCYEQTLAIAREVGDQTTESGSLHQLGLLHQDQSEFPEARQCYEQSLAIAREMGDRARVANGMGQLGNLCYLHGEYERARQYYEQSLASFTELGDRAGVAKSLQALGMLHHEQEEYPHARQCYEQSLAIVRELGDRASIAIVQHNLGIVLHNVGALPEARQCYEQALAIARELGNRATVTRNLHQLGMLHQDQSEYPQARQCYEQSLAIARELGDRAGEAKSLGLLGLLEKQLGQLSQSVSHLLQAYSLFEQIGLPEKQKALAHLYVLREMMGEVAFNKAVQAAHKGAEIAAQATERSLENLLQVVVSKSIGVLTTVPEKKGEWWNSLGQLRTQAQSQGLADLAFFLDLVRRLVEGAAPKSLSDKVPAQYQEHWQSILSGLEGKG